MEDYTAVQNRQLIGKRAGVSGASHMESSTSSRSQHSSDFAHDIRSSSSSSSVMTVRTDSSSGDSIQPPTDSGVWRQQYAGPPLTPSVETDSMSSDESCNQDVLQAATAGSDSALYRCSSENSSNYGLIRCKYEITDSSTPPASCNSLVVSVLTLASLLKNQFSSNEGDGDDEEDYNLKGYCSTTFEALSGVDDVGEKRMLNGTAGSVRDNNSVTPTQSRVGSSSRLYCGTFEVDTASVTSADSDDEQLQLYSVLAL